MAKARKEKPAVETALGESTYHALARQARCSVAHFSLVINGKRVPSLTIAKRIADALGVTIDELAGFLGRNTGLKKKRKAPPSKGRKPKLADPPAALLAEGS